MTATELVQETLAIDAKNLKKAASIYRAINHPLRLRIIEIIHSIGATHVTPIIQKLKLEQSLVSAHLKILRDANIVIAERKGHNIFYSINHPQVIHISMLAERLVPYKNGTLSYHDDANRESAVKSKEMAILFTAQEIKVIQLVCQQYSSEEIADKLGIGKRKVEDYRANVIKKMKVRNSVGILFFAIKNGLFKI